MARRVFASLAIVAVGILAAAAGIGWIADRTISASDAGMIGWQASPFLVAAVLALFPVGWEGVALTAAAALIGTCLVFAYVRFDDSSTSSLFLVVSPPLVVIATFVAAGVAASSAD